MTGGYVTDQIIPQPVGVNKVGIQGGFKVVRAWLVDFHFQPLTVRVARHRVVISPVQREIYDFAHSGVIDATHVGLVLIRGRLFDAIHRRATSQGKVDLIPNVRRAIGHQEGRPLREARHVKVKIPVGRPYHARNGQYHRQNDDDG